MSQLREERRAVHVAERELEGEQDERCEVDAVHLAGQGDAMRWSEADSAAKGMFGDAGSAWVEYDLAAPGHPERVFKIGILDSNGIYRPWAESMKSYADALERVIEKVDRRRRKAAR